MWSIGIEKRILLVKQDDTHLYYSAVINDPAYAASPAFVPTLDLVRDYFNLHISVAELYAQWSAKDPHFHKTVAPITPEARADDAAPHNNLQGIRMLRQDPWENLCAFICSSNNNIKRISRMVDGLCTSFGDPLGAHDGIEYHDFPPPARLAPPATDPALRALGFGYRAKYIQQTAAKLTGNTAAHGILPGDGSSEVFGDGGGGGVGYLHTLRAAPYSTARAALLQYAGVGPKVADCVCLMSLDKHGCVPVDTHVWQIARRDYRLRTARPAGRGKSAGGSEAPPTKGECEEVAAFFGALWGEYAGWAHSVLFTADLKDLNNGLNADSAAETKAVPAKRKAESKSAAPAKRKRETVHVKSEIAAEIKDLDALSAREKRLLRRQYAAAADLKNTKIN